MFGCECVPHKLTRNTPFVIDIPQRKIKTANQFHPLGRAQPGSAEVGA